MNLKKWNLSYFEEIKEKKDLIKCINDDRKIFENIDDFNEKLEFYDPFKLPDITISIKRIQKAIKNKEKICIYGDYDVDGITSICVLMKVFKFLNVFIDYYIPDRFEESYGINENALQLIKDRGFDLVISVDCGITSVKEALFAKEIGLDLIITDHHNVQEEIPLAIGVINPKVNDSYPYNMLAGVGVSYKLAEAILGDDFEKISDELVFLTMLGTIADIVPLLDENRLIVKKGMQVYKKGLNIGFDALCKYAHLDPDIMNTTDIAFKIVPRLNAAGRIEKANLSVELLLSNDLKKADELAYNLNKLNSKRQSKTNIIFKEAIDMIQTDEIYQKANISVVFNSSWHEGVLGIVASKLVEKYNMPAIVLTKKGRNFKGSARSIEGFSIFSAINFCKKLLLKFGGHDQAVGLTLSVDNIYYFIDSLKEYTDKNLNKNLLIPKLKADYLVKMDILDLDLYKKLEFFEPFGANNEFPSFISENIRLVTAKTVGKLNEHLKLMLMGDSNYYDAIKFYYDGFLPTNQVKLDALYEVSINTFNNVTNLQLMIRDLRFYLPNASYFNKKVFELYSLKLFNWLCNSNFYFDEINFKSKIVTNIYKKRDKKELINLLKNNENIIITSYEALLEISYLLYDLDMINNIDENYLDKFENIKVLPLRYEQGIYIDVPLIYYNDEEFMNKLDMKYVITNENDNLYLFNNILNWNYNRNHFVNLYKDLIKNQKIDLKLKISTSNDILTDIIAYSFFKESHFINCENNKIIYNNQVHKKNNFNNCNVNNKLEYIRKLVRLNRWI